MWLPVGHGNFMEAENVAVVLKPESLPVRRLRKCAADHDLLIDATAGRKTGSVIVLVSGQVVLSSVKPETLKNRMNQMEGYGPREE